jgi:glycyl-tRNA synthetase beta chain
LTVDRELLIELGCEELPASWLPGLTNQIGDVVARELEKRRLSPGAPIETFSTPRRLTACIARVADRQSDLEELVTGPPVSAAFKPDGTPTPAATGFAAKQGVPVAALDRVDTGKGEYLGYRRQQRGKAAVDVLPGVLGGLLRGLTFPKLMRWDAVLDDGRGELLFGRPIRWILCIYGGRVVPFSIARTAGAQARQVQEVATGAFTYGHRFLTTSGRAGRAIRVRSFEEYRSRLLENFVILERGARHDKIARDLDVKAVRLKGRVSRAVHGESGLLPEVPDLVEYPSVVAGSFAPEFLELPEEVLTTTLIHHQHYFPVEGEDGRLMPAFLAVINTEPDNERMIARNAERAVTARLRDARFFWEADRKVPLEARIARLSTLLFHKKLGSYWDKAVRMEQLAAWIAREAFGAGESAAMQSGHAARLAKTDLTTDMVREFTELQGTMGGIYARLEGLPEEIWKAIYFQYLPVGVDADAPPSRAQLGAAAATWAAVSLADKLDTIAGLFAAGEKPTGSRDPFGLRRAAHGVCRVLVDLPELTGLQARPLFGRLVKQAEAPFSGFTEEAHVALCQFLAERLAFVLEQRGFDIRNVRAVTHGGIADLSPSDARRRLEALPEFTGSPEFQQLAVAFKRVKNIARALPVERFLALEGEEALLQARLTEPAERALLDEIERRRPAIEAALSGGDGYREAFAEAARVGPVVDRFFEEVLVMATDAGVREARLQLLRRLEGLILRLADVSEMVFEER